MPRRLAVPLTPLRPIPASPVFLALPALFILTQEGSLEGSCEGFTLFYPDPRGVHQSETHPLPFQSFAHSFCIYPGWRVFRHYFTSLRLNFASVLTPLFATLTADLPVLAEISRNRPSASPLDATLTGFAP